MKTKPQPNVHRGSDVSDFLIDEGLMPEVQVLALKRLIALQIHEALAEPNPTKTQLAHRMKTIRTALDRILDPENPSRTVASLGKAAAALGRKVEITLVPA